MIPADEGRHIHDSGGTLRSGSDLGGPSSHSEKLHIIENIALCNHTYRSKCY